MKYKVVWSPRAQKKHIETLKNVKENWNIEVAEKVEKMIQTKISLLEQNKELCPISKIKGVRKCVISKQTSLVYRIKNDAIEIVTLIDNKANRVY